MPDDTKIDMALLLELHSGLEVLKSRQSEINRRIGALEAGIESVEQLVAALKETPKEDSGSEWLKWFWQAVIWAGGITAAVVVGRMFGVEVMF